ncbi:MULTISPECIES: IclR family transcriptional regulator C-terminal domain-containing protein [Streptomyces]|uniref:IclR family transcriptional regulator n=1 Tax=Streptomyces bottropensis ATCC 25435 TaxID=1054862 RepID=M3EUY6_9ACTN|nr:MULTISPECIES: IclR family transcriptional regulator C-terminal domain-containing protein [Streptomyces]EMF52963.1 IclR family transcriptional regulator [Streptomyces bottropensis ATCC 25435]MDX2528446.1 IclR family transcriptional regulator C-terminal domain-containing protein [Streptomyces europaeiscabiei]MDX2759197.1 IclR family transcriptional regulator C-terminal domain-containing protein [Streptomyces europaeiscabiei]MDX2768880.1 IclR family transcriptional regulator C-terminal domain-c
MTAEVAASEVDGAATEQVPTEAVGPLIRGIAVLKALADAGGQEDLQELANRTSLARATLDRITVTLGAMGYVHIEGRRAVLAPPLMELGNAYLTAARIPELLGPRADALAEELDEGVTLTVPDRHGAHFVHSAERDRRMGIVCSIGDRLPLDASAPGALLAATWSPAEWEHHRAHHPCVRGAKLIEACTDDLRERATAAKANGWSLDDQWLEPGLIALGHPVHAPDGDLVCVVNVVSLIGRYPSAEALARAALPAVRSAVADMEQQLRTPPPEPPAAAVRPLLDTEVSKPGRGIIESLVRGLSVLTAFGPGRDALRNAEIARLTGLPRATVRRALITLDHLGYVTGQDGLYRPNAAILSLGYAPLSRLSLAQLAQPHLTALSHRLSDSASMTVLSGSEILYVARAAPARLMTVHATVGTRLPAYATAMGRVLLAGLPRNECAAILASSAPTSLTAQTVTDLNELIRLVAQADDDGYALLDGELEVGLRSMAVPVRSRDGKVRAAINVAMHSSRRSVTECLEEVLPALHAAAAGIERDLGPVSSTKT